MSSPRSNIGFEAKFKIQIQFPSSKQLAIPGLNGGKKDLWEVTSINIARNKQQRTINTVAGARKGFITVEGDLTGSFTLQESDPNIKYIEQLAASNDFFDIIISEYMDTVTTRPGSKPAEWKLAEVLAVGCKIESVRTRYDFGVLPMREYSFKFLEHDTAVITNSAKRFKENDGIYLDVIVDWT
jgi:hypothetical protein